MRRIIVFVILLVFGLSLFPLGRPLALTISPAKIILSADPGEIIELKMRVHNDLDRTTTYYSLFEKYTVRDGEESVFFPEDIGLPSWIETIPSKVTLGPKESTNVKILIKVPENASAGGHYAAIFWSTAPSEREGTGVGIVVRVGALVLLEVSGEVIEAAKIVSFSAAKKVFNYLPVSFNYALQNEGTVHLGPTGQVVIKNIFGKTKAILDVNPGGFYVLPDTARTITTAAWEPKEDAPKIEGKGFLAELKREKAGFALGYYKANLTLEYGKERKTAQSNYGFWILPWRILILVILVLAIIILIATKGIQKYNQWVIAKARGRQ